MTNNKEEIKESEGAVGFWKKKKKKVIMLN